MRRKRLEMCKQIMTSGRSPLRTVPNTQIQKKTRFARVAWHLSCHPVQLPSNGVPPALPPYVSKTLPPVSHSFQHEIKRSNKSKPVCKIPKQLPSTCAALLPTCQLPSIHLTCRHLARISLSLSPSRRLPPPTFSSNVLVLVSSIDRPFHPVAHHHAAHALVQTPSSIHRQLNSTLQQPCPIHSAHVGHPSSTSWSSYSCSWSYRSPMPISFMPLWLIRPYAAAPFSNPRSCDAMSPRLYVPHLFLPSLHPFPSVSISCHPGRSTIFSC